MQDKIGIMLIATGGDRYTKFLGPLCESIKQFMPLSETIIFSDEVRGGTKTCATRTDIRHYIPQPNLGWPRATLMRYHAMLKQAQLLSRFSHVFYMDIDMLVTSPISTDEICSTGITAALHPGYVTTFERNPQSTAYVEGDDHKYFQGCFVGGETGAFLDMCRTITKNIDTDDGNGVMAIYHDESHLNRYLIDHPASIVLSPSYCYPGPAHIRYPERWMPPGSQPSSFVPKIRHLEKPDQSEWKRGK